MQKLLKTLRLPIIISLIFLAFSTTARAQTIVCLELTLGDVCMELLDTEAPVTAQNFLSYVLKGSYQKSFFHFMENREGEAYVNAGEYFREDDSSFEVYQSIQKSPPVINEPSILNTRGTVAIVPGNPDNPDSATSQFLININDNPALDERNGGYTVFARIIGNGMTLLDLFPALETISLFSGALPRIPVISREIPPVNSVGITILDAYVYDGDISDFEPGDDDDGSNGDGDGDGDGDDGNGSEGDGDTDTPTPGEGQVLYEDAVCVDTNVGEFCMELLPELAPGHVNSFLNYINDGDYDDTFIHRSVPNFIVQAGGYYSEPLGSQVPKDPAILNEFGRSSLRGTVAMAKLGGQVNSATNEWFVNVADNTSLDASDGRGGGFFTVFAEIISGMDIVDEINGLSRVNLQGSLGGAFGEVPLVNQASDGVDAEDLVLVHRVYVTDVLADDNGTGDDDDGDDDGIETTAEYSVAANAFFMPVSVDDAHYRMFMFRDTQADGYVYSVDTARIVAIADTGQETATMDIDGGTLVIPSMKIGNRVFYNLEFTLVERSTLSFELVSFDKD